MYVFKVQILCLLRNLEHAGFLKHFLSEPFKPIKPETPRMTSWDASNFVVGGVNHVTRSIGHSDFSPSTLMGRIYSKNGTNEKNTHLGVLKIQQKHHLSAFDLFKKPKCTNPKPLQEPGEAPQRFLSQLLQVITLRKLDGAKYPRSPPCTRPFHSGKISSATNFTPHKFPRHPERKNTTVAFRNIKFKGFYASKFQGLFLKHLLLQRLQRCCL